MNIVAINGGPRREKISKTYWLLNAFLQGCDEAGANVKIVNLKEYDIKGCTGCFGCWTKTPGVCILKDDMPQILEVLENADIEVWSFPLYFFGPTGLFKNFLDRTLPRTEPFFIENNGLCSHPTRNGKITDKIIISTCGFPELDHYKPLSEWVHYMERLGFGKVRAEIYRTAAEFLAAPPFKSIKEQIINAAKKAGEEFVKEGKINPETLKIIQQDFIDKNIFIQEGNKYWQSEIERWSK